MEGNTAGSADTPKLVTRTVDFTVGALLRGAMRRHLEEQRFRHRCRDLNIDWHESKRWLESDFIVRVTGAENIVRTWIGILVQRFASVAHQSED